MRDADNVWHPVRTHVLVVGIVVWPQRAELLASNGRRRDADLVARFKAAGVPAGNVVFLKDSAATAGGIRQALQRLATSSGPGDTLVLCFLGHGGRDLLYGYDFDEKRPDETVFRIGEVHRILGPSWRGSRLLMIGDFCCSGSLGNVLRQFEEHRPEVRVAVLASALEACDSTRRWTFTDGVIRILAGDPRVDRDRDGRITIEEAGLFLHDHMKSKESQIANIHLSANFERDFVIGSVSPGAPAPAHVEPDQPAEIGPLIPAAADRAANGRMRPASEIKYPTGFPGSFGIRCRLSEAMNEEPSTGGAPPANATPGSGQSRWRSFCQRLGILPKSRDLPVPGPPQETTMSAPAELLELSDEALEQVSGGVAPLQESFHAKGRGGF